MNITAWQASPQLWKPGLRSHHFGFTDKQKVSVFGSDSNIKYQNQPPPPVRVSFGILPGNFFNVSTSEVVSGKWQIILFKWWPCAYCGIFSISKVDILAVHFVHKHPRSAQMKRKWSLLCWVRIHVLYMCKWSCYKMAYGPHPWRGCVCAC